MTTERQIEANRQNAQTSTGPKTPEGKAVSSLNALKHGLLSKEVLVEDEEREDWESFCKQIRQDLSPVGAFEILLVDRVISSAWRLRRAIMMERDFLVASRKGVKIAMAELSALLIRSEADPETDHERVAKGLSEGTSWLNLIRYETVIEKQIYKALHEFQRLQSIRRGEMPPLPVAVDINVSEGE